MRHEPMFRSITSEVRHAQTRVRRAERRALAGPAVPAEGDTPVEVGAFLVTDTPGPLVGDELARARSWITSVARRVRPVTVGGSS